MTTNTKQARRQHDQAPGAAGTGQGIHVVAKPMGSFGQRHSYIINNLGSGIGDQ